MRFTRIRIIFIFLLATSFRLSAQTAYLDSLKKCFRTNDTIRTRLDAILNLSGSYINQNKFDSAFYYIDLAMPLAQTDSLQDQLASLYSNKAVGYIYQGSNSQALSSIMK